MPASRCRPDRSRRLAAARQRGVVLIVALIALVLLMIGGVALVRSMDTSQLLAGNLSFKRDLVNRGEAGIGQAIGLLNTGALATEAVRQASSGASNYSAQVLASTAAGIPLVLVNDAAFAAAGMTGADLSVGDGVVARVVIDRQCTATGAFDAALCLAMPSPSDQGGSAQLATKKPGGDLRPVYRISVRVSGPRGTQTFLQTTVAL